MRTRNWLVGGLATTVVVLGAGGWYYAGSQDEPHVDAVCDLDTSTDAKLAMAAYGIAIVEPVAAARHKVENGSSFLVSDVKVIKAVKGPFPGTLPLTQAVEDDGAPGSYTARQPERNVLMEPGGQYVSVVLFGDTTAAPGTETFSSYTQPVRRGLDGEVSYWKQATAASPDTAMRPECHDTVTTD
ncbi:hypothetical protein J7F03_19390 [Streptomyces sp. ISL-43]|uniref:hypothetical protein n=1 Tax=Streptomyces sp. ISL-43 TaxID=2819183 RepID=UPI001BE7B860|nr:hypothetical protein [Streptomyces sp. ISL-43]MBT2449219.1 hypothetical protein [Streptomyces sp. ISL-43]